jgi:holo-[acyl-carrier protein] synthase
MMLVSGVDILHIARIEEALGRHGERLLTRIFTLAEVAYCAGRPAALAARFAAKEAAGKALGVGMRTLSSTGIRWHEAEVVNDVAGRPSLVLSGSAAERAKALGITQWSLSLTHERDVAIAFVVGL